MTTTVETMGDGPALQVVNDLGHLRAEDASGVRVGDTVGSLAERDTGLVRYLDVAVEAAGTHVLVPVGHVRFLREDRPEPEVRLRAALLEDLERIPAFDPATTDLDDPYEQALLHAHGMLFHGERYYAHPAYDHAGLFRSDRPLVPAALQEGEDAAPTTEAAPRESATILPLEKLPGWQVADGEADVRGWTVRAGGREAGRVRELLAQPAAGRVRYLGVEVEHGTVLLPVGFLRLDREGETVTAPGLSAADLATLPPWDGGPLSRAEEEAARSALDACLVEERRYARPDFRAPA